MKLSVASIWAVFAGLMLPIAACGGGAGTPDTGATTDTVADTETDVADDVATSTEVSPDSVAPPTDVVNTDTSVPAAFSLVCNRDGDCIRSCASGRCVDGTCIFSDTSTSASGCIVATGTQAADGTAGHTCVAPGTLATDGCRVCEPRIKVSGQTNLLFVEDFDSGGGQFTIERLAFSSASWFIDDGRSYSGGHSFYFGDPSLRSYGVGARAAADAVMRPLAQAEDGSPVVLTFKLFADTEETPAFDTLSVLVRDEAREDRVVWSSDELGGTTFGAFATIRVVVADFPAGGRFVFRADSIDEIINDFEGFYVDDIRVLRACCASSADCDDADACTSDVCDEGVCAFAAVADCCAGVVACDDGDRCTQESCDLATGMCDSKDIAGCCRAAAECDDNNACTRDDCDSEGRCRNIPICCTTAAQCDDGDLCTAATCEGGFCRYVNSCCTEDAECDDGNACTNDSCSAGLCRNTFNHGPGCCLPDVLTERFDGDTVPGWTLSPATNNIGWRQLVTATSPSAPKVLYYGHPTLLFYESGGRNTGTATSPVLRLPASVAVFLSFRVRLDVESEPTRDLFTVEAVVGTRVFVLATKQSLVTGAWQEVQYDLSWASGQRVQIRFRFDSVDGVNNTGRGISIDDVQVYSDCRPRPCDDVDDCPDRLECLIPACDDGTCNWRGSCD